MKKKLIRILSLFIVAALLTGIFSETVSAQEGFSHNFKENCKALFMFDPEDGSVMYSMNADESLPMASLTKIMTFIVASENIPDVESTIVTVSDQISEELEGTFSSVAGLYGEEKLTVLQLLNMMLIPSGNDAALALQIYYDEEIAGEKHNGTSKNSPFIELMNKKAEELGCTDTHFVNSHGLYDKKHYSTARDLGKIVQYALELPYFKEIVSSTEYTIQATNKCEEERTIETTNKMLLKDYEDGEYYYKYADGIKIGTNDEAGYCIAASATKDDQTYVVIALGSPTESEEGESIDFHGEMIDAAELFDWAFENLSRRELCGSTDVISEAPLKYAWNKKSIQLVPEESVSAILPNDVAEEEIDITLDVPKLVETPVTEGTVLGQATYSYDGEVLATVNLKASESVKRSYMAQVFAFIKGILTSIWFWLIVIVAVVICVVHIRNEKERRRKLRRRRRRSQADAKRRNTQNIADTSGRYSQSPMNASGRYQQRPTNVAGRYSQHSTNASGRYPQNTRNVSGVYSQRHTSAQNRYSQYSAGVSERNERNTTNIRRKYSYSYSDRQKKD